MPFKVRFDIRSKKQVAVTCYDRAYAYIKYNQYFRDDVCTSMTRTVEPVDLTGPEKFLWQVFQARDAQRRYYANRKHVDKELAHDIMMEAIGHEKKLDLKITKARWYLDHHPNCQLDPKNLSFFLIVERWRKACQDFYKYRKQSDASVDVIRLMKKDCEDYEKVIDKYTVKEIGL